MIKFIKSNVIFKLGKIIHFCLFCDKCDKFYGENERFVVNGAIHTENAK